MSLIALVTGASSGFGSMIARDLAHAGHTFYASMRGTTEKNATVVAENAAYAAEQGIDLNSIELDVQNEGSIRAAIDAIIAKHGRIDVLVQNAGHMVFGPSEAFTPEQLAALYDVNVLGAQRVNRAVLPHMRAAGNGLVIWISSSSVAGGVPPLLGPYFAAKAGMDALAVTYAKELAPLGIETSILVPGAFTSGTNHFAHAGSPGDQAVAKSYNDSYPAGFSDDLLAALGATVPDDADPAAVGRAVIDRVRGEFLRRIGHLDLLHPSGSAE